MSFSLPEIKLGHPDSAIRLASAVHRFRVPKVTSSVSFARSFQTAGSHPTTKSVLLQADVFRQQLMDAVNAVPMSGERVYNEATRYLPLIDQLLLTCKVQPEVARLDERLIFEWTSGVEKNPSSFTSEALMYDLVMVCACQALGKTSIATESSISGDFAVAAREYAFAAGIFEFLAKDHLPKWIAKGNVLTDKLPMEVTVATSEAFVELFLANGQQMAIATVLIKPGEPNYSLVAKLCLGVVERLESFISLMRKNAFDLMSRMDKEIFSLIAIQIALQKSLSMYFYARALWESMDYGLAIATLSESLKGLATRSSAAGSGIPDIPKTSPLFALNKDLTDLKAHMTMLLKYYEKDNSTVYFEPVPLKVPEDKKLQTALQLTKCTPYTIVPRDPLPLSLSDGGYKRSDSDLARQLHEQLNSGN
jgi:BRO1-like domain